MEELSEKLIEETVLYCQKRLNNAADAEDLAQEILLEALKALRNGRQIDSFYSWYWKMAHNRYAMFLSLRNNRPVTLESCGGLAAPDAVEEPVVSKEEISRLNFAVSRLAKLYREIVILYYLRGYPVGKIAKQLGVPEGTVKRRLFSARNKLKEKLGMMNATIGKMAYAPASLDFSGGYACVKALNELKNLLAQQMVILCRKEPQTLNALADTVGVAPVYLEPELQRLVELKLLKKAPSGGYLTDFCVFPQQLYYNARGVASRAFAKYNVGRELTDALLSIRDEILSYDFYGRKFDYNYLMWFLIVYACDRFGREANRRYTEKYGSRVPENKDRKFRVTGQFTLSGEDVDGSCTLIDGRSKIMSWSNLHNYFVTPEYGKVEYINDFESQPFKDRDEWIEANNVSLVIRLAGNPDSPLTKTEEEMAAGLIAKGILSRTKTGLAVELPVFREKIWDEIENRIGKAVAPLAEKYEREITEGVEKILLPCIRKDLLENFVYWDMRMFLQPTCYVYYYAFQEAKILPEPADFSRSAAGLWITLHESNV